MKRLGLARMVSVPKPVLGEREIVNERYDEQDGGGKSLGRE